MRMKRIAMLSKTVIVMATTLIMILGETTQAWCWSFFDLFRAKKNVVAELCPSEPARAPMATNHIFQYRPVTAFSRGNEDILAEMSKEVAGKIFYEMKSGQYAVGSRVAVVCSVPLADLKRESEFGRMVAEYYLTDLADRGVQVRELRLGKDITILPESGEFMLSRSAGELATDAAAIDYVVVSTFSTTRTNLILQGRMVAARSGMVKTSWRYTMPLNRELAALLSDDGQPFTVALKSEPYR